MTVNVISFVRLQNLCAVRHFWYTQKFRIPQQLLEQQKQTQKQQQQKQLCGTVCPLCCLCDHFSTHSLCARPQNNKSTKRMWNRTLNKEHNSVSRSLYFRTSLLQSHTFLHTSRRNSFRKFVVLLLNCVFSAIKMVPQYIESKVYSAHTLKYVN